jgi:FKBP-type peptidyl-prolyl cis-trans isomerase
MAACNDGGVTSRNGIPYEVIKEGSEKTSEKGDYLVLNMMYKDKDTDSLWYDTGDNMPQVIQQEDSMWMAGDQMVQVIFAEMNEGDSVTFDIKAEDLFTKTWNQQVPPGVDPAKIIQFNIGLDRILKQDELMSWYQEEMDKQRVKMEQEAEEQFAVDQEIITAYLSENGIEATPTETGIFIEMLEEGNGKEANNGDTVRVAYAGYKLDGQFFDTSYEDLAREKNMYQEGRVYQPYEFVLGQGMVIKGWDQGITELREGDKARLFIPSTLAYGPQQRSEVIGPNSILVFDMEIVEVK